MNHILNRALTYIVLITASMGTVACSKFNAADSGSWLKNQNLSISDIRDDDGGDDPGPVDEARYQSFGVQATNGGELVVDGQKFSNLDGLRSYRLQVGQSVDISVRPNSGWRFLGFLSDGACREQGTIVPDYPMNCIAYFEQIPVEPGPVLRRVGVKALAGGMIQTGSLTFGPYNAIQYFNLEQGTPFILNVIPDAGYEFAGFSDGSCRNGSATVVPASNIDCIASFRIVPQTPRRILTIVVGFEPGGSVTTSEGGTTRTWTQKSVAVGTSITGSVAPDAGFLYAGVTAASDPLCGANFVMPDRDVMCVALFQRQ